MRAERSEAAERVVDVWARRTPYANETWPERVDAHATEAPERWVQSACVLCSTGCALDIGVRDGRIVGVRGRAVDRVNRGRLGPKGLHGWMANSSPDRLTRPLVRNGDRLEPSSWDEAMGRVVERAKGLVREHTARSIGIYNSGQLFLEDYYTLAVVARAGLRTPHLDGNTRLCTATAASALMESFGADGDPGSYEDIDLTDALFLVGHNMAETQTVLWMRVLDRLAGRNPPRLVVVDPRRTPTAARADVHLAPRLGTNLALLNGILHLVLRSGGVDRDFVERCTIGWDELERTTSSWTPARAAEVTGVTESQIRLAADILATTPTLVSTVLQGVYQSMHATASAVQVNNLHLVRGLIGKPGSTVFQMNGQPTAQNTRECGADGELVGFRNWANPAHVADLARRWNVEPSDIPSSAPPTHCMEIFRQAESGSIRMLWIIGTNPVVSLPEISRILRVLRHKNVFLVVQDAFPTETTELADVVLPVALWGEKTGTFTNADRTVHLSLQAVDPPGEARPDLEVFLDFARRMDFRDKDGEALVKWRDARGAFDAFREVTRARPCDYSGLSYEKLSGGSGIQWPCNEAHPDGKPRLYDDQRFPTDPDACEIYGHELSTGAALEREQYAAREPRGRAILKAADWTPPSEQPDADYPFWLTTGRVVHHFHTRTKTGRAPALREAAPEPFVEMAAADAASLGLADGERVLVESRRGSVNVPVRVADIAPRHLFLPFHYGWWDDAERRGAANLLTLTAWDPVSKQPHFKFAAVRVRRAPNGGGGSR